MSAMRSATAMVGLVTTTATSSLDSKSRTSAMRRPHSATSPSCRASSNTALAYRLAAAVATRNLRYRPVDELALLVIVKRLADYLLGRRHDQLCYLLTYGAHGLFPLRSYLLAGCFNGPPRFLLRLLPQLLAQLLAGLVRRVDDALRSLAG